MTPTPEAWTAHVEEFAMTHPVQFNRPDRFISITRARLIARYRMKAIPGRPEELITNTGLNVVSFGYAGGEMRIRKHGGENNREWLDHRDFRLRDGWLDEVYDYLDSWIGYISPADVHAPRPIRDSPQA